MTTDEVVVAVEDENGDVALVDEVVVTREEIVAVEDENGEVTVLADEVDVTTRRDHPRGRGRGRGLRRLLSS